MTLVCVLKYGKATEVYLKNKPVKSEFFMFIGFKKITPHSGGNFGGGAKPPKFPTKLSNFRHTPAHLHSKRLFLALF